MRAKVPKGREYRQDRYNNRRRRYSYMAATHHNFFQQVGLTCVITYIYMDCCRLAQKKNDRAQLSVSHYCRWIIGIQLGVRRRWRRDKSLERPKGERAVNHVVNRQTICAVYIYKGISLFRKARNNIRKKILTGIGLGGSYRKRLNESGITSSLLYVYTYRRGPGRLLLQCLVTLPKECLFAPRLLHVNYSSSSLTFLSPFPYVC